MPPISTLKGNHTLSFQSTSARVGKYLPASLSSYCSANFRKQERFLSQLRRIFPPEQIPNGRRGFLPREILTTFSRLVVQDGNYGKPPACTLSTSSPQWKRILFKAKGLRRFEHVELVSINPGAPRQNLYSQSNCEVEMFC